MSETLEEALRKRLRSNNGSSDEDETTSTPSSSSNGEDSPATNPDLIQETTKAPAPIVTSVKSLPENDDSSSSGSLAFTLTILCVIIIIVIAVFTLLRTRKKKFAATAVPIDSQNPDALSLELPPRSEKGGLSLFASSVGGDSDRGGAFYTSTTSPEFSEKAASSSNDKAKSSSDVLFEGPLDTSVVSIAEEHEAEYGIIDTAFMMPDEPPPRKSETKGISLQDLEPTPKNATVLNDPNANHWGNMTGNSEIGPNIVRPTSSFVSAAGYSEYSDDAPSHNMRLSDLSASTDSSVRDGSLIEFTEVAKDHPSNSRGEKKNEIEI